MMGTRDFLGEELVDGRRCLVFLDDCVDREGHWRAKLYVELPSGVLLKRGEKEWVYRYPKPLSPEQCM